MSIFDEYYGGWSPEGPRRRDPEPMPGLGQYAEAAAAKAVAGALAGLNALEQAETLKQLLVHVAAQLQGLEGHVETSETLYRVGDHMAVACATPNWREI